MRGGADLIWPHTDLGICSFAVVVVVRRSRM